MLFTSCGHSQPCAHRTARKPQPFAGATYRLYLAAILAVATALHVTPAHAVEPPDIPWQEGYLTYNPSEDFPGAPGPFYEDFDEAFDALDYDATRANPVNDKGTILHVGKGTFSSTKNVTDAYFPLQVKGLGRDVSFLEATLNCVNMSNDNKNIGLYVDNLGLKCSPPFLTYPGDVGSLLVEGALLIRNCDIYDGVQGDPEENTEITNCDFILRPHIVEGTTVTRRAIAWSGQTENTPELRIENNRFFNAYYIFYASAKIREECVKYNEFIYDSKFKELYGEDNGHVIFNIIPSGGVEVLDQCLAENAWIVSESPYHALTDENEIRQRFVESAGTGEEVDVSNPLGYSPSGLTDYDRDGIYDIDEGAGEVPPRDTDTDLIPDYKDLDSDNDGVSDILERDFGTDPYDDADFPDLAATRAGGVAALIVAVLLGAALHVRQRALPGE